MTNFANDILKCIFYNWWLPFWWWHFNAFSTIDDCHFGDDISMHFLQLMMSWHNTSGSGLTLNRPQATAWTNDDWAPQCRKSSLGLNGLIHHNLDCFADNRCIDFFIPVCYVGRQILPPMHNHAIAGHLCRQALGYESGIRWNYLFIPNLQRRYCWSLGMDM